MRTLSPWAFAGLAAASCLIGFSPSNPLAAAEPKAAAGQAAAPPPYAPPPAAPGVFEVKPVSADTVQLVVKGRTLTSRQDVEQYMLYRAATLTLDRKAPWFLFVRQPAPGEEATPAVEDRSAPPKAFRLENFQPVWRYQTGDATWKTWSPFSNTPFLGGVEPARVTAFEVTAQITPRRGAVPYYHPLAYEAAPLSDLLANKVKPPT